MTSERKPKGLKIYSTYMGSQIGRVYTYVVKGKGRTGAASRYHFTRLNRDRQQALLHKWATLLGDKP